MLFYERIMRRKLMMTGARPMVVPTGDGNIHVLDIPGTGTLPTLVMVHGFTATAATQWGPLVKLLRNSFSRIIAPDLLGHGHSAVPIERLSGEAMARALGETLDALLDHPVMLFGASMGGGVALRYARRYPSQISGLMLCSPGVAPVPADQLDQFIETFRLRSHRDALAFIDKCFPHGTRLRQVYAWGVRQQFNRPQFMALLENLSEEDFLRPEDLRQLRVPVLLLWGEAERVLPRYQLRFFREHLPAHARIERPRGFGHAPFLDRVQQVAEQILGFARSLSNVGDPVGAAAGR